MVTKEGSNIYIAKVGESREDRMWNKVDQVKKLLEEIDQGKDSIEEIHLSNNSIGLEVSAVLAEKIFLLKNLKVAGFNDIYVSRLREEIPKSLTLLINSISDKNILVLNLSDNAFGPIGVSSFDFYLKSTKSLKELYLENNGLGPEGASLVAEALKSNSELSLERIRIGRNRLENKGATAFGEYFSQCKSLIEVVAFQNGIKDEGMANFLHGLCSNSPLEILKVNDNTFGEKSVSALLGLLDNLSSLKTIDISDSKLGGENSVRIFEKLVKINSISEIYCNYNEIEEKDDQNKLVNCLLTLKSKFPKIQIKGNEIKKSIFKIIKSHEILKDMDVYSESEMDEEELSELMSGLKINK